MTKNYFLLFTLILFAFSFHVKAQTLNFNSDAGSTWDTGIATDGEGGSIDISGLSLQIYNVNDALINIREMEWRSADDLTGEIDDFSGLTTWAPPYGGGDYLGWKGHIIKETSGLEFQINAFNWYDWGNWNNQTMTVTGYKNGSQVATANFVGNNDYDKVAVTLNSDFDSVDEVRILTTTGTTFPSINNIEIAGAVLSTAVNVLTDVAVISKNHKFISNTDGVKIEVYNLLGQILENENLSRGIYIVKASLKNGRSIVVKRYI